MVEILTEVLKTRTTGEWLALLRASRLVLTWRLEPALACAAWLEAAEDALGNRTEAVNDYRLLGPVHDRSAPAGDRADRARVRVHGPFGAQRPGAAEGREVDRRMSAIIIAHRARADGKIDGGGREGIVRASGIPARSRVGQRYRRPEIR